jgi:uncharacterized protein YdhG (YjbR/CyaY superfamily)
MDRLRELVREVANELPEMGAVEESLKWGEPGFRSKMGSTLRMDWKPRAPEHYALYFQCTTKLVDAFRLVFGPVFAYEGTRAIVFHLDQPLPESEIKACIRATLMYHKVKHLDMLGM